MVSLRSAVLMALFSAAPAFAQSDAPPPPELEAMVRKLEAGFNAHDAQRIAAVVAPDGAFVNPMGERAQGREAIAKLVSSNLGGVLKDTQHAIAIEHVRMVTPELAFLDLRQEITGGHPPPSAPKPWVAHAVMLARKDGGSWSVLDFRPYFFLPRGGPGTAGHPPAHASPGASQR